MRVAEGEGEGKKRAMHKCNIEEKVSRVMERRKRTGVETKRIMENEFVQIS